MPCCSSLAKPLLAAALLWASGALQAQFKVVDADGRITYTDRPPATSTGVRVSPVRRDALGAADSPAVALPLELRQIVARFPVTLYAAPTECPSCDNGRQLLQSRGIPFSERLIVEGADAEALLRQSGSRTVPTVTVGGQVLRGFNESEWRDTLDLAGYPRESRLPRNYVAPVATPLASRAATAAAPAPLAAAPAPVQVPSAPTAPPEPPGEPGAGPQIRF